MISCSKFCYHVRCRHRASPKAILELVKAKGHDAVVSHDAGRFMCHFVYYHFKFTKLHMKQFLFTFLRSHESTKKLKCNS